MSLPAFILDSARDDYAVGDVVTVSGPEGRHAVTVKRLTVGEQLLLLTDVGVRYTATVTATRGKDTLQAAIDAVEEVTPPTPQVVLIQALPKSERSELAIDLATQGGVDAIVPWAAEHCIAKWVGPKAAKGRQKWLQAAQAAAKQARRASIPPVAELAGSPAEAVARAASFFGPLDMLLVLDEDAASPFRQLDFTGKERIGIVIGPEGGISDEEIAAFRELGGQAVLLGPEVLRAANAGFAALAAIGASTPRW
ncbi:16S rRNA (uracil(1498)-N(3))-methyltransferase [Corynebacterium sp. 13CS0277]|uniref:16S rRNA (uracil(1498)-N(3))-methyltransferase n=1 Tax=Corynebacterium sp. 13CS0277 TaxID=2071994 RepID=UPI000D047A2C|nr:16S rRNA (uracil(1498)-N(3))-methyltransferase [Corynebacterium sp. 13CS0277]PRQ10893.1 16S rRNA (uracil(1498)-N(3))-methyltransferase [Corynebacterium sp. 13CS0277]